MLQNNGRMSLPQMLTPVLTKEGSISPVLLNTKIGDMIEVLKIKVSVIRKQHLKQDLT